MRLALQRRRELHDSLAQRVNTPKYRPFCDSGGSSGAQPNPPPKTSKQERAGEIFKTYGTTAVVVYGSLVVTVYSTAFAAVYLGVDVEGLMQSIPIPWLKDSEYM